MRPVQKGTANVSVVIRIVDSTDGTPETGVTSATTGLDLEYRREGAASVDLTESDLSALTDAHSDGGMLHIGNGYYRVDLPDAACASGADGVLVHGTATGMVVIGCYVPLVDYDPYDSVRMGMTALPNAAADGAGGLPISDAGGLDLDTLLGYLTAAVATASALATAQADLDTLTGTDGATLATTQGNYAPAKAGDAMALTSGERTTLAGVIWDSLTSGMVTVGSIGKKLADWTIHSAADVWSVATRVLTANTNLNDPTAAAIADAVWDEARSGHVSAGTFGEGVKVESLNTQAKADVNAEADTALTDYGANTTTPPTAAAIADAVLDEALSGHVAAGSLGKAVADVEADTNELQTDWANGGRLDLLIDAIKAVTDVIPDSGAMTSIATASALSTVDTVVDAIKVITDALGATAAARLALSAGVMVPGTVDTVTNTHTPTTTEFQADDITEATADHYIGRIVIFTSGALQYQATDITDYAAVGGIGQFTVTALTEAPANNDTFIIV